MCENARETTTPTPSPHTQTHTTPPPHRRVLQRICHVVMLKNECNFPQLRTAETMNGSPCVLLLLTIVVLLAEINSATAVNCYLCVGCADPFDKVQYANATMSCSVGSCTKTKTDSTGRHIQHVDVHSASQSRKSDARPTIMSFTIARMHRASHSRLLVKRHNYNPGNNPNLNLNHFASERTAVVGAFVDSMAHNPRNPSVLELVW